MYLMVVFLTCINFVLVNVVADNEYVIAVEMFMMLICGQNWECHACIN